MGVISHRLLILTGLLLTAAPAAATPHHPSPAIIHADDRGAMAAVRRSAAYLRHLPAFALDAEMTIDAWNEDDHPVREVHDLHYEYRAPSGLFVDWRSNGEHRQIFCNGRHVSFVLPKAGAYVTMEEEGNAADMLFSAAEDFGVIMPLPDLFLWVLGDTPADSTRSARRLGLSRIAGVATDHFRLHDADLDWEIWIDRGPHPLPRRILITARDDPDRPQFAATLRWNLAPRIAAGRFTFVPPAGARRILDDDDDDGVVDDVAFAGPARAAVRSG